MRPKLKNYYTKRSPQSKILSVVMVKSYIQVCERKKVSTPKNLLTISNSVLRCNFWAWVHTTNNQVNSWIWWPFCTCTMLTGTQPPSNFNHNMFFQPIACVTTTSKNVPKKTISPNSWVWLQLNCSGNPMSHQRKQCCCYQGYKLCRNTSWRSDWQTYSDSWTEYKMSSNTEQVGKR